MLDQVAALPIEDAQFAEFLVTETASEIREASFGPDWSGLRAMDLEQGDDAFNCPPLDSHLIGMCTGCLAYADLRFGSLIGGRRSIIEPKALCFMRAGDSAHFDVEGRYEVTHVLLRPAVVEHAIADRRKGDPARAEFLCFHGGKNVLIEETIASIAWLMSGARDALVADHLAIELAQRIVGHACDFAHTPGASADLTSLQFAKAVGYIEENLTCDFGLEEIAAFFGVEPTRMAKSFDANAGCSLHHYRTERRLGIVQEWLKGHAKDASAEQIACAVGFGDAATLDAAFRSHFGISFANFRAGRFG